MTSLLFHIAWKPLWEYIYIAVILHCCELFSTLIEVNVLIKMCQ